ncbi:MAG: TrkH family potassium uptake protein, partial [Mangrovimonas sp.]|nr:TrkH family potassium uptake protein [Mangrovimonas sp.]
MKLNYKIIFHFFGLLLLFNGGFMLLATLMSLIYKDGVTLNLLVAGLITVVSGISMMYRTRDHQKQMNKREGYLVVTFGWIIMALSGTLPYILTNAIPS